MAEYILHDGINEQDEELRYASARAMAIGSSHMSSLMLGASDDLEIPLISVRTPNSFSYQLLFLSVDPQQLGLFNISHTSSLLLITRVFVV